jgi:DNA-binding response OmpR family regulator
VNTPARHVLVVEDDRRLREAIAGALTGAGFVVSEVRDGAAAVVALQSQTPDVVLLDIGLPFVDGWRVLAEMHHDRQPPVIIISARGDEQDKVRALDLGADDYLAKPFAFAELVARIRALSRREPSLTQPVLHVADLELDTTTRSAKRGERAIALTTKEYALLEYLMRNPNRVLTRTMITERVWNYDALNAANVIDVYIGHLRRKVDHGHATKLIQTIRGAGYKIAEPGS